MIIPRYDDISILFMLELGKRYDNRFATLSEIAQSHGLSALFLKKIARTLLASNLVKSKEGKFGGYKLTKSPTEITLWDVITSISPHLSSELKFPISATSCPIRRDCLPQRVHNTIDATLQKSFSTITLADLLPKGSVQ